MRFIEIQYADIKVGDHIQATETFDGGSTITHEGKVEKLETTYEYDRRWKVGYVDLVGIPRYEYTAEQLAAVRSVTWYRGLPDLPTTEGSVIRVGTRAASYDGATWHWTDSSFEYPTDDDLADAEILFVAGHL